MDFAVDGGVTMLLRPCDSKLFQCIGEQLANIERLLRELIADRDIFSTTTFIVHNGTRAIGMIQAAQELNWELIDNGTIAAIVAPDAVIEQSPEVLMLAERISRLSDDQCRLIDAAITGIVFKGQG